MDPINGLAVQLAKNIFQTDQKAKKKRTKSLNQYLAHNIDTY